MIGATTAPLRQRQPHALPIVAVAATIRHGLAPDRDDRNDYAIDGRTFGPSLAATDS